MKNVEILRAYKISPRLLLLGRALAQYFKRLVPAVVRRSGVARNARRHHSWHRSHPLSKLSEIRGPIFPFTERIFVDGDNNRHHMTRLVSERSLHHAGKSLN